jgi:hypothetical protein
LTVYEHLMVGGSLALAGGLHYRHGWRIVGLAAFAAALPDWDGLSLLFGSQAYDRAHRVWGHNLLVALTLGGLAGGLEFQFHLATRLGRAFSRLMPGVRTSLPLAIEDSRWSLGVLALWVATGMVASLSHLAADLVYSGHPQSASSDPGMGIWYLSLLWPFSKHKWAFPIVAWGDLGATLIFVAEMFALYRWPGRAQRIAWIGLAAVVAYVIVRWALAYGTVHWVSA